jgi:O-antigen/teichoic acid export membrane protein
MKHNIAANIAGGLLNGGLVLLVTPIQLALLGTEAYGLLSLIAALQVVIGALDLGLSTTVTRAVARDAGDMRTSAARLINSAAAIYWFMALIIGACIWLLAGAFAERWLKAQSLPPQMLVTCIQLMGIFLAVRWPIAFYAGIVSGAQQMTVLNAAKSIWLTVRILGGALLLFIRPDLVSLLLWYCATAFAELGTFAVLAARAYPALRLWPSLDLGALRGSFRFSAAMYGIAMLGMLLSQLDRLVIGNVLGLEALGAYAVAYNLALGLSLLQTAINSAALPAYASAHSIGDGELLDRRYTMTSQLMGAVLTGLAFVLIVFGREILTAWAGAQIAASSYIVLATLVCGFWLNAVYSNCYILCVAMGQPALFLRINIIGLPIYVVMLAAGISQAGIVGAAAAWTFLNLFYVVYGLYRAHAVFNLGRVMPWFLHNFGIFITAGFVSFLAGAGVARLIDSRAGTVLGLAVGCALYALLGLRSMSPALRKDVLSTLPLLQAGAIR